MTSVLHVSQATTEGVGRYLESVIHDQTRRGWRVAVATPPDSNLEALCASRGARHLRWDAARRPGPRLFGERRRIAGIVAEVAPDVVHLHSSKAGLAGRLALRGRRPTVFTPHAWSFHVGGRISRRLARAWERWATRWTDILLCVGDAERERGRAAGLRGTWRVVPNAIDLDVLRPASAAERSRIRERLDVRGPTVVCVGRLAPQKGQDLLLEAWAAVRARVPDATLVLVGDGPLRESLARDAGPGVRLVGTRPDVRDWLVAADVVALPSRWEGLSYVVLESVACGCCIVATDVDGIREVLGEGPDAAGAIVPVGNASAIATAIVARLEDGSLRRVEQGRARARADRFGSAAWGDRIASVLTEAVSLHEPSTATTPR